MIGSNQYQFIVNDIGRRRIHSTLEIKEGIQRNRLFGTNRRSFSTNILPINLDERVLITKLEQIVENCKLKDGRYGKLIQIIGSPAVLKLAYLMIKNNSGIHAKGVDKIVLDGVSKNTIINISKEIIKGTYKFDPVRRILIPKPGKADLRPLGVSNPRQKIVQKAIDLTLTIIFERTFLDCSHGFRPGRSCHTALKHLQFKIGNASTYTWVIEGDIKGCFDNIPHHMILKGIKRKIDCPPTITLIKRILDAGYILNDDIKRVGIKFAKRHKSKIGTPQGIILSPLFSNIVLHEFDKFVETDMGKEYNIGLQRKANLSYRKLRYKIKKEKNKEEKRKLINQCLKIPSKDHHDPTYKRIFYLRYVDDWVILCATSYKDAKAIKEKTAHKLKKLGLTMNMEKTKITQLRKEKVRFLGVNFFIRENTDKYFKPIKLVKKNDTTIRQRVTPRLILHAPILDLLVKLKDRGFVKRNNKGEFFPISKSNCIALTHPQILNFYNSKIRGILNYYSCVHNRNSLWSVVRYLTYSCALTLARKFKLKTLRKSFRKFGRNLTFKDENKKEYKIYRPNNLKMLPIEKRFKIDETYEIDKILNKSWSGSLTLSQFDEPCALCGTLDNIEIHHIRSVKNIRTNNRTYEQWVGSFYRKSIPLCKLHHNQLHANKLTHEEIKKLSIYRGRNYLKKKEK
jgi:nicotine oxidoreductase